MRFPGPISAVDNWVLIGTGLHNELQQVCLVDMTIDGEFHGGVHDL